jgi:hypothetical protein
MAHIKCRIPKKKHSGLEIVLRESRVSHEFIFVQPMGIDAIGVVFGSSISGASCSIYHPGCFQFPTPYIEYMVLHGGRWRFYEWDWNFLPGIRWQVWLHTSPLNLVAAGALCSACHKQIKADKIIGSS